MYVENCYTDLSVFRAIFDGLFFNPTVNYEFIAWAFHFILTSFFTLFFTISFYMLLYLSLLYVKPQYAHYIIARLAVYIKDPCKQGTQNEKKLFLELKESERKGLLYKN